MFKLNKNSKLIVLGVLIGLTAAILFFLFTNNRPVNDFVPSDSQSENLISLEDWKELHEGLFTVSGKFTCLPLKDETKPHNDLCVFGIKSGSDYYQLKQISDDPLNVLNKSREGENIEISGELLASENEEYISSGLIKVKGIRRLESPEAEIKSSLPASFKADYISFRNYGSGIFRAMDYPNTFASRVLDGEIDCDVTGPESSLPLRLSKRAINGKTYCVGIFSEGAAGSIVSQYAYTTVILDNVYLINFVANYPNCTNYPEKELTECHSERESFNLDLLVDAEIEKMKERKELEEQD